MEVRIEAKDIILRKIDIKDKDDFFKIRNEENILKWMPDWKATEKRNEQWINYLTDYYDKQRLGALWCQLAIERKSDGAVMGMIALQTKEEVNNETEIAYFISSKYSGKGYMKQAAKAILDWGMEYFNLPYVIAIVELDNYASQKVVEYAGFKKIETRSVLNSGESEEKPFYYYRYYKKN